MNCKTVAFQRPGLSSENLEKGLDVGTEEKGGGGGSANVSCQLKSYLFVNCLLNFGPFVSCQLRGF